MTRQVLQAVAQDVPEIQRAAARLERIEAEVARVGATIAAREALMI